MSSVIRQIPLELSTQHHAHEFHQIVIGLRGRAEFEIEGLGGEISAFSGCIVPTNHMHYYVGQGENRQLILDLPTDASCVTGHHHELSRLFDAPRFFALDQPLKHFLEFLILEQESRKEGLSAAQSDRLAATFLGCLHARLGGTPPPPQRRRLDLAQLDRFIDRHLAHPIAVADLAAQACLSEAHFSSCFREQTGLSPWQYVRSRRLATAHRLLEESRMPISQIAQSTGFTHQSALTHAFRSTYGCPPSHLRRRCSLPRSP